MNTALHRVVLTGPFGLQLAHAFRRATDALIMEDLTRAAVESVDRAIGDFPESVECLRWEPEKGGGA